MPNYLPYQVKRGLRIVAVKLLGAALLALAAAAAIGLATYSPLDPSPFSSSTFKTTNAAGPAGAYIAATLLYAFGGAGALVVTAGVFAAGLALTRSKPPAHPPIMTASLAIIATFSASLAATFFDAGGLAGAASLAAIGATGYIGIAVFLLAAVIAAAAIFAMLNVKLSSLAKVRLAAPTPKRIPVKPRAQEKPKPRPSSSPKPTPAARTSSSYRLPPTSLLDEPKRDSSAASSDEVNRKMGKMLEDTLAEFGLEVKVAHIRPGPVITLFETEVGRGIKTSRITSLSEDIARNMAAHSTRVALIPGTNRIGIELPNMKRKMVYLKEQLESDMFATTAHALPISLGSDTSGAPVFVDLAKMPHLLIAGTTGSGKSVGVNAMILSLLYKYSPDEVKMIMIDPKMLEFAVYNDIPHLLIPVVTEPVKAVAALKWAVREMEDRNRNLSAVGAKNIESYNERARQNPGRIITREVQTGFDPGTGEPIIETRKIEVKPLPYIVVIVDEMADLMLVAGKEVEAAIARLAAMARAAGIHLILSTQRPSVDVITGTIKSNFPNRIAYRVASKIDSRTIINEQGAELMLGKGDMLYMAMGGNLMRIHGAFVSEDEVERVVKFVKAQAKPSYAADITAEKVEDAGRMSLLDKTVFKQSRDNAENELYAQAVNIILQSDRPSISFLQRQLGIGYNKSANLIEKMQQNGLLSAPDSTGKRTILGKK